MFQLSSGLRAAAIAGVALHANALTLRGEVDDARAGVPSGGTVHRHEPGASLGLRGRF